jgi:hypothetical protein
MTEATFICEVCWKAYPKTCPTCPDRGAGRGVTVAQIKDAMRSAPDHASLNATHDHYRKHIGILSRTKDTRAMSIQIDNLASHRHDAMRASRK